MLRCGGGDGAPWGNNASSTILSVKLWWELIEVRAPAFARLWICANWKFNKNFYFLKSITYTSIEKLLEIWYKLTLCVSSACCCVKPDTLSISAVLRNELSDLWWTLTSPWYINSTSESKSVNATSWRTITGCLQGVLYIVNEIKQ